MKANTHRDDIAKFVFTITFKSLIVVEFVIHL